MSTATDQVQLIGTSAAITSVREEIAYASRCDAKILITGESGVGKEVVARLIHAGSDRRRSALVTVNCAALTETLLETELFGHVRGSFTGAFRDRTGVLEQAHRGTVFMDEIGETTPRMQGLLLRFLETGEIQRVGSERADLRVNVRVIAATNRNLAEAVADKTFREDLFYRLNVIQLRLPPLRERHEDVEPLLVSFLESFADHYQMRRPTLAPDAFEALISYKWPGNVRELKNVAERLVVRNREGHIELSDLPPELMQAEAPPLVTVQAVPRNTADDLFNTLVVERGSFWSVVYGPFMSRDMTREDLRIIVRKGLERTGGSYRLLTELFNMQPGDYKRFLNFLRKHHCHVAFQQYRTLGGRPAAASSEAVDTLEDAAQPWNKIASA